MLTRFTLYPFSFNLSINWTILFDLSPTFGIMMLVPRDIINSYRPETRSELSSCTAAAPMPPSYSGSDFLISSESAMANPFDVASSLAIVDFPDAGGPTRIIASLFLGMGLGCRPISTNPSCSACLSNARKALGVPITLSPFTRYVLVLCQFSLL